MMFARIQRFYNQGLWTKYQVWVAVGANAIIPTQYKTITGDVYDVNNPPVNPNE